MLVPPNLNKYILFKEAVMMSFDIRKAVGIFYGQMILKRMVSFNEKQILL